MTTSVSEKMLKLGTHRSTIREIFEYGRKRKMEVGQENVFDFSLGNPNVPSPREVNEEAIRLLRGAEADTVHAYSSAPGFDDVRARLADSISRRFGTSCSMEQIFMTCGAAASLTVTLKAISVPGDEVMVCAPYFPEYKIFVEGAGDRFVMIEARTEDFQLPLDRIKAAVSEKTKAMILNSPNNPCGVVYTKENIMALAEILERKEKEYGHPIYLIADEPYREIAYAGVEVPFLPLYYRNTIVCYSYSKSLSLPGERIGYILVPDTMDDPEKVMGAVAGAARVLGYVCAPTLFQKVVAACADQTSDIAIYEANKNLLYNALLQYGYSCVEPGGAFYLFPRSLEEDAYAFCEHAKKYDLLLVPGDDFGCPGHVRISYCVQTETIERALPLFRRLAQDYGVCGR